MLTSAPVDTSIDIETHRADCHGATVNLPPPHCNLAFQ